MKIVFMGTPQAAVPCLERILQDGHEVAAVYTQPDKPSGRSNKISFSPVKEFALANDLPIFQPVKIKTAEAAEIFQSHNADAAVVVAYGRILPESFLCAYPRGAINVHFSLLPKYRGAAPVNWAIVRGETETGVTTMLMDAGLDTGDILLQSKTGIAPEETSPELMQRLSILGAYLLSRTLSEFDDLTPRKQDEQTATYAPILKKEDGLIDWNWSAKEISDRARGFQPFPTCYTKFQDKKLTIWKSKVAEGESQPVIAGQILLAKGDELIVACGENSVLAIAELQLEGKRRMPTRDFLNGVKIQIGDKIG